MADAEEVNRNPRRVRAGRENRLKRPPLSLESRARLRVAAFKNQPWKLSTGPRTPAGKAKVARNGKVRQIGPRSIREIRAYLRDIMGLIEEAWEIRESVSRTV